MQDKAALAPWREKAFSRHMRRRSAMTVQSVDGFQTDVTAMRRGACPTLSRPMQTGDGLLARLRPAACRMTLAELRAVARAAADHGNGILEVTARGSLQIRGLRPETVAPFERAILEAGVVPASGVMVEVPPLAGIDPDELIDPLPVAEEIREGIRAHVPALGLAPKLAIVVDGGGRLHLGAVSADVRLTAIDFGRLLLAIGGSNRSARKVAIVETGRAASAVVQVLEAIAAIGPTARGKDVDPARLGALFQPAAAEFAAPVDSASVLGIHAFAMGGHLCSMLGIGLPYRQVHAQDLIGFVDEIEILGVSDIRLSPGHGLILTGLNRGEALKAEQAARRHGFWTSPTEPRASMSLCAGTSGCASALFDTRSVAELIARRAAALLDGSLTMHLSGCAKGCAHPAAAPLTLVGAPSGYGLVVNGAACDAPAVYIAANDLGIALERLASLVAGAKEAGETVSGCIQRLGGPRIADALTLDGQ